MNFWDKAILCQIAQLENEELIKVSVVTRTKSIAYLDSKLPNFGSPYSNSPSDNVLTFAKRSTYKSEDERKSPSKQDDKNVLAQVEVYAEPSPIDLTSVPGVLSDVAGQTESGIKAKLTDKDQKVYDNARKTLLERLENTSLDCTNLLANVGGLQKVKEAINLQRAFDGETSTISAFEAGLVDTKQLENLSDENKSFVKKETVAYQFKNVYKTSAAQTAIYVTGNTIGNRSDVYFRPDRHYYGYGERSGLNQRFILHEALHSLTGLSDIDLLKKLTGKIETSSDAASLAITKALVKNGCVK